MRLKPAENSLFALLMRSPWWISVAIAAGIAAVATTLLPERYALAAALGGTPFVVVGALAAWRQLRAPSASRVASTLEALGHLTWDQFATALEDALRRDGYAVTRLAGAQAQFEVVKAGRTALVGCRRWKAASLGVGPLRDLHRAAAAREAHEGIYVAVGTVTDNARRFAADNRIRILHGAELAQMLRGVASRNGPRRHAG
jgi:restriction system protein